MTCSKQTLQLADFLGHSANAVRWQAWTALLVYVLLRFPAFVHGWTHSFTRIFTVVRTSLRRHRDLPDLLRRDGTADGSLRLIATPQKPRFAGF
jgi:hypothetical protein